ncbi:hypothetical protein MHLP_03060 [Candidatus Mycoplasma haematolamae str. Purdue]|uniref:Uncharacterized protein n=1 Tax=Mycoplasma haematolamae (strain Purdue) TaxID=1212765 RepID=I7C6N8_MYCHA|nr:hypothetical protein [Candidatus Mycoplasma haematolamae]AFO52192.1 hypothetical protein MHLP_03060 [Candidatus Mycoplasma haematolamae str. Purdue]
MNLLQRVGAGVSSIIAISGSGAAIYQTATPKLQGETKSVNQVAVKDAKLEATQSAAKALPKTKDFKFVFGNRTVTLACPEGSHPDASLDKAYGHDQKLAIFCQKAKGRYRWEDRPQNSTLDWDYLHSARVSHRPTCTSTDGSMTTYVCKNYGNLNIENKDNKRLPTDASSHWIKLS